MTVVFPWDLNDKLRIDPKIQVRRLTLILVFRDTRSPKGNQKKTKDHMTVAFPWDLTYHYLQLLYCE